MIKNKLHPIKTVHKRLTACLLSVVFFLYGCVIFGTAIEIHPVTETPENKQPIISSTQTISPPTITPTIELPSITPSFTPTLPPTPVPTSTITPIQSLPGVRFPETPVRVPWQNPYPEGQLRILLLGVDLNDSILHADSITVLSVNTRQSTASLLSIPSTLYVNIPDVGMERLNNAISFGGAGKVMDTLEYNLGFRANKYLLVDARNFAEILDSIGNIKVQVASQLISRCSLPQAVDGWCDAEPGVNQMDSQTALWYVRDTAGGEPDRMRRTQEVLVAVFNRLMEIRANERIGELYNAYLPHVETDLSMDDLFSLAPSSTAIYAGQRINRFALSTKEAVPFTMPGGEQVLLLDQNSAWNLIQTAIFQL